MENKSYEKAKILFEHIIKECREQKFTVGEFELLVFKIQTALDNRRTIKIEQDLF